MGIGGPVTRHDGRLAWPLQWEQRSEQIRHDPEGIVRKGHEHRLGGVAAVSGTERALKEEKRGDTRVFGVLTEAAQKVTGAGRMLAPCETAQRKGVIREHQIGRDVGQLGLSGILKLNYTASNT